MISTIAFTQDNNEVRLKKSDTSIQDQECGAIKILIKKSMPANKKDSGEVIFYMRNNLCKGKFVYAQFLPFPEPDRITPDTPKPIAAIYKPKFLTIQGTISYDFFYRSRIDTPIAQNDLQQHTERINLNITIKEKYPFKVSLIARQSNSPYFKDFIDMNYQFDKFAFNKDFKQQLVAKLSAMVPEKPELTSVENALKEKVSRYEALKNWLNSPATLQKIIEERERKYNDQLIKHKPEKEMPRLLTSVLQSSNQSNSRNDTITAQFQEYGDLSNGIFEKGKWSTYASALKDTSLNSIPNDSVLAKSKNIEKTKGLFQKLRSLNSRTLQDSLTGKFTNVKDSILSKANKMYQELDLNDSLDNKKEDFIGYYNKRKVQFTTLTDSIKKIQHKTDSLKNALKKELVVTKQKIYKATSEKELKKIASQNCIEYTPKDKIEKVLSGIKTLGIGRSILNYTELTAKNITVTGINIEYNNSYYAAFTAGKIDYRFRDFFNNNKAKNNQYLVMGRFGIGDIERKALILSVFQGRKSNSQSGFSDSINNSVNIFGYSLEAIYKKDENTGISAEFAKSTMPASGSFQENKQINTLWKFSDKRNMGVNIKAQTLIEETNTKLSGFFRKTGEAFQSFSLFSYNTDQTAWLMRADQSFLKNKIVVTGMLRQNDFTNPFTEKTFKTSTTFKSVLLNIRFPKYPSLSIGYYPASQLYFINKEKIRENAYYILNSSLVYSYYFKGIGMNSSVLYNQYFNQATDSGFVLYKGVNYYASQTVFLKKFQVKAGFAYNKQPELRFYTLESSADYTFKTFFKVGAGLKYNKIFEGNSYWGERILMSADFKKWGVGLQLQYEKTFLPTFNKILAPVDLGRVSMYKNF